MNYENENEAVRGTTFDETDAKCPNCGAPVNFDPGTGHLKCDYCGYEANISIDGDGGTVDEIDFESELRRESYEWGAEKTTIICESCGATTIYDALEASNVCPYCGSNQVVLDRRTGSIAPTGMIPFAVTAKQAGENFKGWLKGKLFTPSKAKKSAKADAFRGMYIPYWTFDTMTTSNYTAEYGKDRRVKRGDNWHTVTDWHHCSGIYQEFFDDELVNASSQQSSDMLKKVEPFELEKAVPYKAEYMAGIGAERYSLGLNEGWEAATDSIRSKLDSNISSHIRRKHWADHVRFLNFATQYDKKTYKHLLLPLWFSSFEYKGKRYDFLVNGQTGQVGGNAPISPLRVAIAIILGLAAAAGLYYFFNS